MRSSFTSLLHSKKLSDHLPERVFPVAAHRPTDFQTLMNLDLQEMRRLVAPGSFLMFLLKCLWYYSEAEYEQELSEAVEKFENFLEKEMDFCREIFRTPEAYDRVVK